MSVVGVNKPERIGLQAAAREEEKQSEKSAPGKRHVLWRVVKKKQAKQLRPAI
jgi:hypothetical protein